MCRRIRVLGPYVRCDSMPCLFRRAPRPNPWSARRNPPSRAGSSSGTRFLPGLAPSPFLRPRRTFADAPASRDSHGIGGGTRQRRTGASKGGAGRLSGRGVSNGFTPPPGSLGSHPRPEQAKWPRPTSARVVIEWHTKSPGTHPTASRETSFGGSGKRIHRKVSPVRFLPCPW